MKKNEGRFISAIFCDDIRHELGGKMSYMGCYRGEIVVETAPVLLPKLCAFISITTPKERPFESLMFRVVQDDDVELARINLPTKGLTENNQIFDKSSTRTTIDTSIVFSPFAIEKSTMLRLMATTEEGEIAGPRILIKVAATKEPAAQSAKKLKTAKPRTIK